MLPSPRLAAATHVGRCTPSDVDHATRAVHLVGERGNRGLLLCLPTGKGDGEDHSVATLRYRRRPLLALSLPSSAAAATPLLSRHCWSCFQPSSPPHTTAEGGEIAVAIYVERERGKLLP
nr:hypothetical protein Itr_chr07CG09720 [Ipomoea trifida]